VCGGKEELAVPVIGGQFWRIPSGAKKEKPNL